MFRLPFGSNGLLGVLGGKFDFRNADAIVNGRTTFSGVSEEDVVEIRSGLHG
jgi:hypothetical protein